MSYTPGIPTSGSSIPAQDRSLISQNFTQLNTQFAIDHTAFNAGSNQGYHKQITYQAPLAPAAPAGTVGLGYTKTVSTSGSTGSELHYRNANKESQITFSALTASSGQGSMPGGLQIRAVSATLSVQNETFTFSPAFPTACIVVVTTNSGSGDKDATINVTTFSPADFQGFAVGGGATLPVNFNYIAIGY